MTALDRTLPSALRGLPRQWLLFIITLIAYLLLSLFGTGPSRYLTVTSGDEPHYLVLAHSLYFDGDFDASDDYRPEVLQRFFDGKELKPHLFEYNGRIVPHHRALGLPALIAIPYGLAGRLGVLLLLNAIVAAGMLFTYRFTRHFMPEQVAFYTTLFCGLTYPLLIYSYQIYPETIAFTLVALVLALAVEPAGRFKSLMVGIAIGLLLQLHIKLAVLGGALYLYYLWRNRREMRQRFWWSIGPIVLVAAGLVLWYIYLFGSFMGGIVATASPTAFLGDGVVGIVGIWFDQEYGLFFFAPVYFMSLVGWWHLWRGQVSRLEVLWLTLVYLSQHVVSGAYFEWFAGLSSIPRYMVPVLPLLIMFAGYGVAVYVRERRWLPMAMAAAATLWLTYMILIVRRSFMFGYEVGKNAILDSVPTFAPMLPYLPSFHLRNTLITYIHFVGVAAIFIILWNLDVILFARGNRGQEVDTR